MMLVSRAQHVERIRCKLVQDQSSNALRVGAAHASASAAQASADEAKHTDQADGDSVSTSSGVTSCCICLEEFEQDDMLLTLPCGHCKFNAAPLFFYVLLFQSAIIITSDLRPDRSGIDSV
eukprot:TRINITY_DN9901_c1_g2_i3.p2 TRINITY_DN9901_c1_g2~~TRINITY_DN9901_c1_g2_i3.p2  ORF type:complete len:121 (+),score=9.97 TRINITY_DN9901_c1_g2_i3:733-1095(+)